MTLQDGKTVVVGGKTNRAKRESRPIQLIAHTIKSPRSKQSFLTCNVGRWAYLFSEHVILTSSLITVACKCKWLLFKNNYLSNNIAEEILLNLLQEIKTF